MNIQSRLLLFLLIQFLILPAHADLDRLIEKVEQNKLIKRTLENADIKTRVSLFDLNLADIAFLKTAYKYEVEPSFVTKGYLRTDSWQLNTGINAGDLIKKIGAPLYFGIETHREIIFVRQFAKQSEALKALPEVNFTKIPTSASAAKNNLIPGEFISLPVTMNIVVGAQYAMGLSAIPFSVNGYMGLTGSFTLQALRINEDKLRIRIIADRNKNTGIGADTRGDFNLLDISVIDNAMEKIVDLRVLNLNHTLTKGDVIIADYIFNLNNLESMSALDAILANPYQLREFKGAREIFNHRKEESRLIANLEQAEQIYLADQLLAPEKQRVHRVLLGKNSYISRARNLKVGTQLINLKAEKSINKNKITFTENDGTQSYFYFPTYSKNKSHGFLWSLIRETEEKDTGILFVSNSDFSRFKFTDYVLNFKIKDTHLYKKEIRELKNRLFNNFPDTITKNFSELDHVAESLDKATVNAQVVFNSNAYKAIDGTSYAELKASFDKYARIIDEKAKEQNKDNIAFNPYRSQTLMYTVPIKHMLKTLSFVLNLDPNITEEERIDALVSLRKNKAFDKFGIGFIMSLLTEAELKEFVQVSISLNSKNMEEPLILKFGNSSQSEFYETLLKIRAVMGLDLMGLR